MIDGVVLENFKCFARAELRLAPLSLVTGMNGAGKSSILQALLFLRQSWQQGILERGLAALNGELVQLGTAHDLRYEGAEVETIAIELSRDDGHRARWEFAPKGNAQVLEVDAVAARGGFVDMAPGRFHYLSAERLGPRVAAATSDHHVKVQRELGVRGEYAAHFLAVHGDEPVQPEALRHPMAASEFLARQVEAWLDTVSPGTRLLVLEQPQLDVVKVRFQFENQAGLTNEFRPTNVGFGLSCTMPVLTAVLGSPPGSLLLIENPEAHLHPRGQAQMGRFLALAAATGRQLLIETHSDHVLNGVRLAVHAGLIPPADVALHYVERPSNGEASTVVSPRIDRDGRIDRWPAGFFDEWDSALDQLLTPAKR